MLGGGSAPPTPPSILTLSCQPPSKQARSFSFLSHFFHRSQFSRRPPKPPVFRTNAARSSPEPYIQMRMALLYNSVFYSLSMQISRGKHNLIRYCPVQPQRLLFLFFISLILRLAHVSEAPTAVRHERTGASLNRVRALTAYITRSLLGRRIF